VWPCMDLERMSPEHQLALLEGGSLKRGRIAAFIYHKGQK
jgi:hypothetical protein